MAVRIRVELLDLTCRDTEDVTVPDSFYLMAVLAASDSTKSVVITDPFKITAGETRTFPGQDSILFDGLVTDRETVIGGLKAFDEDFSKDWTQKPSWVKEILLGLPSFGDLPESPSEGAELLLTAAENVLDLHAHSDRDDLLARHTLVVPVAGRWSDEERLVFKEEGLGLSTWDYTLRYLVTRTQMV